MIKYFISAGTFITIILIIYEIRYYVQKKKLSFLIFITLLVFIAQLKIFYLLLLNSSLEWESIFFYGIPTIFIFIGTLMYFQIDYMLSTIRENHSKRLLGIWIGCVISEIFLILYFPELYPKIGNPNIFSRLIILSIAGLFGFYTIKNFQKANLVEVLKSEYVRKVKIFIYLVSFIFLFCCSSLFIYKLVFLKMNAILVTSFCFIILFIHLFHPGFFENDSFRLDNTNPKYTKSKQFQPNQIEELKVSLENLMREKKLYRDEDLRIEDVAAELMISKNQFSRILNEYYKKNFYQFINFYRIEEAKKILINLPEKTVLDIAYEIGYKSKSSFYKNFTYYTQMTPQDFRESKAGGNSKFNA